MRNGPVSVVIPVYNGERYLAEAISSALAQTAPPGEIMVVDDGSTDGSAEVARGFGAPVRSVTRPHAGLANTLNHGIELARGAFLAFLDADDLWVEDKLSRQLAALRANPEADLVFAHVGQFVSPELDPSIAPVIPAGVEVAPGYLSGALLIRAGAFHRVGLFDPRWQIGNFIDWYLRAQDAGLRALMLPEVLLRRRVHRNNLGSRERGSRGDYARILKRALDRRRGASGGQPAAGSTPGRSGP